MDAGRRREVLGHRIWISDAGQDDGVPLLLLHGGPGVPHDHFEPLVEALRERRRVIVYDQLGCGLSDKPQDESLWTVEHYLAELQEIVRKLKLKDFAILGQSWGGMLALEYAALRPEGLRGLILSNSLASSEMWNTEARELVRDLPNDIRDVIVSAERDGNTDSTAYAEAMMFFYKRHVCRLPEWPECLNRTFSKFTEHPEVYQHMWGASEFYCIGTLRDWDMRERLHLIDVPTLLISGEFDEATPSVQRELLSGLRKAEWELVEGASHLTHLECPLPYQRLVNGFLDRL